MAEQALTTMRSFRKRGTVEQIGDDGVHDAAPHRGTVEIILRRKFVSARGGFPDLAPYAQW